MRCDAMRCDAMPVDQKIVSSKTLLFRNLHMSFFCTIFVLHCSMQLIYYVMKRKIIVSSKTLKFRNALRDVCKAKRKEMTNLMIQLLDIVDDYYQGNTIVSPSELLNHIGLDASYENDLIHLYNINNS